MGSLSQEPHMSPSSLLVFYWIAVIGNAVTGLLAAYFVLMSKSRKADEKAKAKEWFRAKWVLVHSSKWLLLPQIILRGSIRRKDNLVKALGDTLLGAKGHAFRILFGCMPVLATIIGYVVGSVMGGIWMFNLTFPLSFFTVVRIPTHINVVPYVRAWVYYVLFCVVWWFFAMSDFKPEFLIYGTFATLLLSSILIRVFGNMFLTAFIGFLVISIFGIGKILQLPLPLATLLMLILCPVYGYLILGLLYASTGITVSVHRVFSLLKFSVEDQRDRSRRVLLLNPVIVFGFSISFSFSITLFALLIGSIAEPAAYVAQNAQMLFSNVLFDGLTVTFTFALLDRAARSSKILALPIVIGASIVMAAIFAFCSLYFGLAGGPHALTPVEVMNVMIGKAPDGVGWQLGPSFWAMHTTFLPTIVFLLCLLVAWGGKALALLANWFFGRGKEHDNPYELTAALLALISAMFYLAKSLLAK